MSNRGSILITTLWAMMIFSIITASLVFSASQHVLMMKREINHFKNNADFISAVNEVCSRISSDPYPHEDSAMDLWFGEVAASSHFSRHSLLNVEDEESKINLNEASENFLNVFLKIFQDEVGALQGSRKDYVKGILKLRSVKRIESLEQLLLIEGFERDDFDILRPYITVYPDQSLININTVKPLILKAMIRAIPGDQAAKSILIGKLTEASQVNEGNGSTTRYFLSRELRPDFFVEKLHLPKTPAMITLVQEFLSKVTVDSETFHVAITTPLNQKAETIFRLRSGQPRPEVFYWHGY